MNLKVHYRLHKSLPLVPILSQINPAQAVSSYFLKIYFNVILQSTPCVQRSLPFRFHHQNSVCISLLSHTNHSPPTPPVQLILLDFIVLIISL